MSLVIGPPSCVTIHSELVIRSAKAADNLRSLSNFCFQLPPPLFPSLFLVAITKLHGLRGIQSPMSHCHMVSLEHSWAQIASSRRSLKLKTTTREVATVEGAIYQHLTARRYWYRERRRPPCNPPPPSPSLLTAHGVIDVVRSLDAARLQHGNCVCACLISNIMTPFEK